MLAADFTSYTIQHTNEIFFDGVGQWSSDTNRKDNGLQLTAKISGEGKQINQIKLAVEIPGREVHIFPLS